MCKKHLLRLLDDCSLGILSLDPVENCMTVTTNRILCGVELAIALLVMCLMLREISKVSSLMRAMLVCYSSMLVLICVACIVSYVEADATLEAQYVIMCFSHIGFVFGVSCRTLVLARVVYLSSPKRFVLDAYLFSLVFCFVLASFDEN